MIVAAHDQSKWVDASDASPTSFIRGTSMCSASPTQVIAALRSTEALWHHIPEDRSYYRSGERGSSDGHGGSDGGGSGGHAGPVRVGSEREELYKMYSEHIEVRTAAGTT